MQPDPSRPAESARPLLIGWKEYLDFPIWKARRVKVKIDTGARTSALGVMSYQVEDDADEGPVVRLRLAPYRRHPERVIEVRAPVLQMVRVKNTAGIIEERPLIEAVVRLGPVLKRIQLTITSRDAMLFPMILGREALKYDFVVDVSRKYLLRKG